MSDHQEDKKDVATSGWDSLLSMTRAVGGSELASSVPKLLEGAGAVAAALGHDGAARAVTATQAVISVFSTPEQANSFDELAAWMRKHEEDEQDFINRLAIQLREALPSRTRIDEKRPGLFSKEHYIRSISVSLPDRHYVAARGPDGRYAYRIEIVHRSGLSVLGIIPLNLHRNRELDAQEWYKDMLASMKGGQSAGFPRL